LGDGGYQHPNVLTKNFVDADQTKTLEFLRGLIEIENGLIHTFKCTTDRFRESPGFQVQCLVTVYELWGKRFKLSPVRPHLARSLSIPSFNPTPIASSVENEAFSSLLIEKE
jgi:hypothetical protein